MKIKEDVDKLVAIVDFMVRFPEFIEISSTIEAVDDLMELPEEVLQLIYQKYIVKTQA